MALPALCRHDRSEVRVNTASNGVRQFARQCLDCWYVWDRWIAYAKLTAEEKANAPEIDDDAQYERETEQRKVVPKELINRGVDWWAEYNEYLQSPQWQVRRDDVLRRDDYLCRGCLTRRATQAHHLTYDHVGAELLFELVAICDVCHERIHPHLAPR